MAYQMRSRGSSTSTKGRAEDQNYAENNLIPARAPSDRTPLMEHPQDISEEALRALSYLLVASIILTLAGFCLIFFTENIREVLWQSIVLIILGTSATVITVLPDSGPYIVDHWKNMKCSLLWRWRHWTCSDFCNSCYSEQDVPQLDA